MEMPGHASYRVTLGGYWVIADTELQVGPRKVKGLIIYGYDTYKQRCSFQFIQESDTQVLFGLGVPSTAGDDITFDVPNYPPLRKVTASSVAFTLADLLRSVVLR